MTENWQKQANCKNQDIRTFYPTTRQQEQHALNYCKHCPVRTQCFIHSIENEEVYGIWGGTTELERIKLLGRSTKRR